MLTKLKKNNVLKLALLGVLMVLTVPISLFAFYLHESYVSYISSSNTITKYQVVCIIPAQQVFLSQSPDIKYAENIENGILVITADGTEIKIVNTPCTIMKSFEPVVKLVP